MAGMGRHWSDVMSASHLTRLELVTFQQGRVGDLEECTALGIGDCHCAMPTAEAALTVAAISISCSNWQPD